MWPLTLSIRQNLTFELSLGLVLSWLWSSSDSGRGLGFLSSDSRRWASDGSKERNDFSSISSSVIESSNFTEYSVVIEALSADWSEDTKVVKTKLGILKKSCFKWLNYRVIYNQQKYHKLCIRTAKHDKFYLSPQASCVCYPSARTHRQLCEPDPPLNCCLCLSLSSPDDRSEMDSTGHYCCHHH